MTAMQKASSDAQIWVSHTLLPHVTIFLSASIGLIFFQLLFPIFVLNLSVPVCQFVKAPHYYCQKSHCSATTKDPHTISHTLAHTRTYRPLRCWKRVTSSSDTQRQASPRGILNTTRQAKWTQKSWSLWFSCHTFSPLVLIKLCLSPTHCGSVFLLFAAFFLTLKHLQIKSVHLYGNIVWLIHSGWLIPLRKHLCKRQWHN